MLETKTKPVIISAWSRFSCKIGAEEKAVFDQATKPLMGVKYEAVAVASQLVSGMNYNFFCNAKVVHPDAPDFACFVHIYKPLDGNPSITEIKKI